MHSLFSYITSEHSAVKPDAYKKAKDMTRNGYQPKHIAYIARLPLKTGQFYMLIREYILARKYESFWHFLKHEDPTITFSDLIHDLENSDTLEVITNYDFKTTLSPCFSHIPPNLT